MQHIKSVIDNVDTLKTEIEKLIGEKETLEKATETARSRNYEQYAENKKLEDALSKAISSFDNQAMVISKGLDQKLLNRILRAADGNDMIEEALSPFNTSLLNNAMSEADIIERLGYYIRVKSNRDVSDNDIINFLICISQGFITTFAGEPGTGKTSLCNILAKALGLSRKLGDNRRFVDISVERGWTSHKDLIGYYNPLTRIMEKSNVEIFEALKLLDKEDEENVAPFIILLDEANLSPIEHYWSVFLKNCDFDSTSNRSITLGGNNTWHLPKQLRFVATVNFDHTTEELSPRYLDRSWIITLAPSQISDELTNDMDIENCETMISFDNLQEQFGYRVGDIIDDVIAKKWNSIRKIYEKHNLPIMPRNLKMIRNYCLAACRCMDRSTPETRFAPLDYAVSQKILPIINGTGDLYKQLIEELKTECSSMPLCTYHLERIEKVANDNMGFYQFFAR